MSIVQSRQPGFTLIELMITIAIIGILAAIAIPYYQQHNRREYFAKIVSVTYSYRDAVTACIKNTKTLTGCNAGTGNIPAPLGVKGAIASLTVTNSVITVIPKAQNGITASDTYILTPTLTANGNVTWVASGGSVISGYTQ